MSASRRGVAVGLSPISLGRTFWSKVEVASSDECWEWRASRNAKGYGRIKIGGRRGPVLMAHRLSWAAANGQSIPDGQIICHSCDNPPCVNPAHLFLGTCVDNVRDMMDKGRNVKPPEHRGTRHRLATVSDVDVHIARKSYFEGRETLVEIAERLGVGPTTVGAWMSGRNRLDAGGPTRGAVA